MRRHHLNLVARAQTLRYPVRKQAALNLLDGDLHQPLVGRDAQRIITADFLAVYISLQRQMLPRPEPERVRQIIRHLEADRHRLVGLGHDLRHPQHMKMLGHFLPDSAGISPRDVLHHRQQMPQMLAMMPAPPAQDRPLVGRRL